MSGFDYLEPSTVGDAIQLCREHGDDAHLIAGGASLMLMLRQQLVHPTVLVGLRQISELRGISRQDDGGLELGAVTTHRAIEGSEQVAAYEPALAEAFARIATVRIRNQGTIGGNLAHADPAQDPPPMLLALDAIVVVAGPHGERTLPVGSLFLDYFETTLEPAELITAVRLPPRPAGAAAVYTKFLPQTADDYATVSVAASAHRDDDGRWHDVRLAVGAAGPVPIRAEQAEAALEGTPVDAAGMGEAAVMVAEAVDPIDDLRGTAAYKREMARVWTQRTLERLARKLSDGEGPVDD